MPVPPSPIYRKAEQLLADGEWHDYEAVMYELTKVVPPGVAMRRNEQDRRSEAPRKVPRDTAMLLRAGARSLAADVLRSPRFEVAPPGRQPAGVKKVRLIVQPVLPERFTGVTRDVIADVMTCVQASDKTALGQAVGLGKGTIFSFCRQNGESTLEVFQRIAAGVGMPDVIYEHTVGETCETCGRPGSAHVRLKSRKLLSAAT